MGDNEHRALLHQSIHAGLHQSFRMGVDGGSGLVQDHDGGIGHGCAGDGDQLPLPLGKAAAVCRQHGVVAVGQTGYKIVRIGELGGPDALFVGGVQFAVANVIHDRAGEQIGLLKHDPEGMPQIGLGDLVDVDAVVADLAVGNIIEPVDEVRDRGLARAGSAHKGDLLPGMGIERHVMQHGLARHIAKVHILHGDVALQLRVGHGAVRPMGILPGPVTGVFGAFVDRSVRIHMGVDKRHIAFILLGLLIHQSEDALGARQCHDDGVNLVGDLGNGHIKAAREHHEGHQIAQRQQRAAGRNAQQPADDCQHRILHIAKIVVDGAEHIGKFSGAVGVGLKLLVELIKIFLAHFLVVEDLDDLLAGYHLFDITVYRAQSPLLADEKACGLACQHFGHIDDQPHGEEHDERQNPGGIDQIPQHDHQRHGGGHALRNGLGDHLPQRVDVAGIARHDVSGGVAVKVAQGETLHLGEEVVPDGLLNALGNADHQIVEEEGAENTEAENAGELHKIGFQRAKIRGAVCHHGQDIVIDQRAKGTAALCLRYRCGDDAQKDENQQRDVFFHIAEQPQKGFSGIGCLAAVAAHSAGACHQSSLPFCCDL